MSLPASRARTVFRACVVNAIREGEAVMQQLAGAAQVALAEQAAATTTSATWRQTRCAS